MGRIADILTRVRDSLSDSAGDRWGDDRLLRLIDEAQRDLAKKALLLRSKIGVALLADVAVYELPVDTIHTLRFVDSDGVPITTKTHEQMDLLDAGWEIRTGEVVKYIVYDKANPRQFKIYPILLASDDGDSESFTVSDLGVVTAVDDDAVTDFGVAASITTSATKTATWNSDFGVLTDMTTIYQSIIVYYYRYPETINAIDIAPSELEIDAIFDRAIKLYCLAEALLDDKDTQDVTLGRSRKKEYREDRDDAKKDSAKEFTRAPPRRTEYSSGFQ